MTENTFKAGIAMLSKLFGSKLDDEMIPAYWNILNSISDDKFLHIQQILIKTFIPTSQVPFPLPAHFLNAGGMGGLNRGKLAVMAIIEVAGSAGPYQSVSFGDPALHSTIERFGGWPEVSSWDLEKWQYNEKNFVACYDAAHTSGVSGPERLMGIFEFENKGKQFLPEQMKYVKEGERIAYIGWAGFDRSTLQLGHAVDNLELQQQKYINDLTNNIGKKIPTK